MSKESVERARKFALKWAFDHNFNWPKDEPSERTYDGDSSLKMMVAFADSEKRETVKAIAMVIEIAIQDHDENCCDEDSDHCVTVLQHVKSRIEAEFGGSGTGEK